MIRHNLFFSVCGILLGLLPGLVGAEASTQPALRAVERKTYEFKAGDIKREIDYALYVPSSYNKTTRTPLVVALHGLYSNPQQIMHYPGMMSQAEKDGFIVVAPMGFNNHGWYGAKALVRGREDDPANLPELSEQDVMNVLGMVRKDYNIDAQRIYLIGHSMGGGGVIELAIRHPELWAGLAAIAPATLRPATDAKHFKALPIMIVQGDEDALVRVERVRPWAEEMKKLGMDYEYVEVPGGNHISVAFNNLPRIFSFLNEHKRQEPAPEK